MKAVTRTAPKTKVITPMTTNSRNSVEAAATNAVKTILSQRRILARLTAT